MSRDTIELTLDDDVYDDDTEYEYGDEEYYEMDDDDFEDDDDDVDYEFDVKSFLPNDTKGWIFLAVVFVLGGIFLPIILSLIGLLIAFLVKAVKGQAFGNGVAFKAFNL